MIFNRSQFTFFGKREVNALYATLAIGSFADGLISVFVPVFLWNLGLPLWQIVFFYFLNSLYFVILAFLLLPLLEKVSDKMMMFISMPFLIVYYFGLNLLTTVPTLLYILPLFLALNTLFFNIGYNLDFSQSVDGGKIGKEIGARNTVAALTTFAAPFFGGILITWLGFANTFVIASMLLFSAVIPLFFFPYRRLAPKLNRRRIVQFLRFPGIQNFNLSGIGYANETFIGQVLWPLFMFTILGGVETLGGTVSIGLLMSILATYFVGFLSDAGQRRIILGYATILFSIVWVLRLFFHTPDAIMWLNIAGGVVSAAVLVAWASQYYKISRAILDPSLFILSREVLYNISRVVLLPFLMLIARFYSLSVFFAVSFIVAALFQLLYLYANKFHINDLDGLEA